MKITSPNPNDAPWWSKHYFKFIEGENDMLESLEKQGEEFVSFLKSIPDEKWDNRYEEGKWSVKGVVSHIIDTERIFQYRALRTSREDVTNMAGFDENAYDVFANLENRSSKQIIAEFDCLRKSSMCLFEGMNLANLDFVGVANEQPTSARSLGWLMVGHAIHHQKVIEERYL
jgi:uncharacterized damage-inducible protein DinB